MIQAIRLGNSHSANIYTDSQYALAIVHVLGVLYQKQGLLTSMGKEIKIKKEVSALVTTIWLSKKLAIIHCPGHQKGNSIEGQGHRLSGTTAKRAATEPRGPWQTLDPPSIVTFLPEPDTLEHPTNTSKGENLSRQLNTKTEDWWVFLDSHPSYRSPGAIPLLSNSLKYTPRIN